MSRFGRTKLPGPMHMHTHTHMYMHMYMYVYMYWVQRVYSYSTCVRVI